MLGSCIGLAFHPKDGLCDVYQSLDTTDLVVLVPRNGSGRRFMRRGNVDWRRSPTASNQEPGATPRTTPENPSAARTTAQLALFESET